MSLKDRIVKFKASGRLVIGACQTSAMGTQKCHLVQDWVVAIRHIEGI